MVIEFLTFQIDPADRAEWLIVEENTWSRFLEQQAGFVRKQLWVEQGNLTQVHAMIEWRDLESWHAIPSSELAAIDASMGLMCRDATCRTFDVIRNC